jgi:hypothetical protein
MNLPVNSFREYSITAIPGTIPYLANPQGIDNYVTHDVALTLVVCDRYLLSQQQISSFFNLRVLQGTARFEE